MDTITKPLNRRDLAKRATHDALVSAAREAFTTQEYETVTIRGLAKSIGRSTGSVFCHFDSKGDLWRTVMGCEPPADTAVTRAAPALLSAAKSLMASINQYDPEQRGCSTVSYAEMWEAIAAADPDWATQ